MALDSGALDFAPFADIYAYFINALDKGLKAKEVVLVSRSRSFPRRRARADRSVLATARSGLAEDLKGKKIGTQWPSFSGVLVRARLAVETRRNKRRHHDRAWAPAGAIAAEFSTRVGLTRSSPTR